MRIIMLILLVIQMSWAIPQFAREYQTSCFTCHTNIPMLNETGESFLRNGFRFSPDEVASLKEFITHANREYEPLGAMVGINYSDKNQNNKLTGKVLLFFAGTLNKYLSVFASSKQNINTNDPNAPKLFEEASSIAYVNLVYEEPEHLLRTGLMAPFTQLGNIQRAFADSGLQHLPTGVQGRDMYKSPLQRAGIGNYKGAEYSYLWKDKFLVLVSYGDPVLHGGNPQMNMTPMQPMGSLGGNMGNNPGFGVGPSVGGNMGGSGIMPPVGGDTSQFLAAIRYFSEGGWKVGLLYGSKEEQGVTTDSFIVPIEKDFGKWYLTSLVIYSDNEREGAYKGVENALLYKMKENTFIRAIINYGEDSNENSEIACALSYSVIVNNFAMIHLTGAYVETLAGEDDAQLKISFNLFF